MYRGKAECNILKKIRHQIATENGIEYKISECDFQGDCKGTCPKCESELKYLENQLIQKKKLGKSVLVAGLSAGIITTLLSCQQKPKEVLAAPMVTSDSVKVDKISLPDSNVVIDDDFILFGEIPPPIINGNHVLDGIISKHPIDTPIDTLNDEIKIIEDDPSPFPGDSIYIENKERR